MCKISQPSITYLIYTSQHSDVITRWSTVVSGQRPRLMLTFFCTLLCYFLVVLYKWVLWMLFNSYSYEILYDQFHWIYLQGDCWLLLITGLNLKSKSFTPIVSPYIKTDTLQQSILKWRNTNEQTWKWRIMVQMRPSVSLVLPSTISSARMFTSRIYIHITIIVTVH